MSVRPLQWFGDYYKGYMKLINGFTRTPTERSIGDFEIAYRTLVSQGQQIFVIEKDSVIVASITVQCQQKLHNNFNSVLHIEDLIVLPEHRGKGYAKSLIEYVIKECSKNCYKIVLTCNEEYISFYKKCGFMLKGNEMCKYTQD
jgi:glucosamine-phosphate N-acetyltransferase